MEDLNWKSEAGKSEVKTENYKLKINLVGKIVSSRLQGENDVIDPDNVYEKVITVE